MKKDRGANIPTFDVLLPLFRVFLTILHGIGEILHLGTFLGYLLFECHLLYIHNVYLLTFTYLTICQHIHVFEKHH